MRYFFLFLLITVSITTSSVLGQASKINSQQTAYSSLSQYKPLLQTQDIPADKTIGVHWWNGRSMSYDENPVTPKKGQNLIISFENPSDKLKGAGSSSYWSGMYRVKYIIYGASLSGYNQNPFDFTKDDHTPYNLRFQATASPGPTTINFVVTYCSKHYDNRSGNWYDNPTGQITSSDLNIIIEDDASDVK